MISLMIVLLGYLVTAFFVTRTLLFDMMLTRSERKLDSEDWLVSVMLGLFPIINVGLGLFGTSANAKRKALFLPEKQKRPKNDEPYVRIVLGKIFMIGDGQ